MTRCFKFETYENDILICEGTFSDRQIMVDEISDYICQILRFKKIASGENIDIISEYEEDFSNFLKNKGELVFNDIKFKLEKTFKINVMEFYKDIEEPTVEVLKENRKIKIRLKDLGKKIEHIELIYRTGILV